MMTFPSLIATYRQWLETEARKQIPAPQKLPRGIGDLIANAKSPDKTGLLLLALYAQLPSFQGNWQRLYDAMAQVLPRPASQQALRWLSKSWVYPSGLPSNEKPFLSKSSGKASGTASIKTSSKLSVKPPKLSILPTSPTSLPKITQSASELRNRFKGRLRTQDRHTHALVWLLPRLYRKIPALKKTVSSWLTDQVENTIFYCYEVTTLPTLAGVLPSGSISKKTLTDIDHLTACPMPDGSYYFEVYLSGVTDPLRLAHHLHDPTTGGVKSIGYDPFILPASLVAIWGTTAGGLFRHLTLEHTKSIFKVIDDLCSINKLPGLLELTKRVRIGLRAGKYDDSDLASDKIRQGIYRDVSVSAGVATDKPLADVITELTLLSAPTYCQLEILGSWRNSAKGKKDNVR
jgi:hypothetical protein